MFEDRKRKKTKRILFFMFLVFICVSFAIGYYMNLEPEKNAGTQDASEGSGYKVPDSLINPVNTNPIDSDTININPISKIIQGNIGDLAGDDMSEENIGEIMNILDANVVGANTELRFRTTYTKCGHSMERKGIPRANEIGMNEIAFAACYTEWLLESFSKEAAIFKRSLNTYCPHHYIIGIYGGNIAIFVYNQDGEKILKEETDISISSLPPEDQALLQQGIVAGSEEELYMKIEGFSD